MSKRILVTIFVLAAPWTTIQAQSLLVGTVELGIGMPEAAARQLLNDRYKISPLDNAFMISDNRSNPPNIVVGRVAFTEGKVSWISRDSGPYSAKTSDNWAGRVELAEELLSALKRMSAEGTRTGLVLVKEGVRGPEANVDYVRFQFDQRAFTLVVGRGRHDQVTMEESVQAR